MLYQPPLLEEASYFSTRSTGIWSFRQHWHHEIEILYCVRGQIQVGMGTELYTAAPGEAILVSSTVPHSFCSQLSETECLVLECGTSLMGEKFALLSSCHLPPKPEHPRFFELLRQIHALTDSREPADILERQGLVTTLAAVILRDLAKPDNEGSRSRSFRRADGIGQVLAHISTAYQTPLSLPEAAAIAQYEPKSFCRAFKNTMGLTFHQYLNAYRIEQACRLFREDKQKIGEVGKLCGIPEPKTFSRLFRQHTGMTPSEYIQTFCQP